MSPLQTIKEGIIEENWFKVMEGYLNMTGEDIRKAVNVLPKGRTGNEKTKKGKKHKLKNVVEQSDAFIKAAEIENPTVEQTSKDELAEFSKPLIDPTKRSSGGGAVRMAFTPKVMQEYSGKKNELKDENAGMNKLMNSFEPTNRRRPAKMVDIPCALCKRMSNLSENEVCKYGNGSETDERPNFYCDNCIR